MNKQSIYLVIEKCKFMIEQAKSNLNGEELNDLYVNYEIELSEHYLKLIEMIGRYENEIDVYDGKYYLIDKLDKLEDDKLDLEKESLEELFVNLEIQIIKEYIGWLDRIDFEYHYERLLLFDILNKVIINREEFETLFNNRNIKQINTLDLELDPLYNKEGFIIEVYEKNYLPTDENPQIEKYIIFLNS